MPSTQRFILLFPDEASFHSVYWRGRVSRQFKTWWRSSRSMQLKNVPVGRKLDVVIWTSLELVEVFMALRENCSTVALASCIDLRVARSLLNFLIIQEDAHTSKTFAREL